MHYKLGQACVTNWGSPVVLQLVQTLLQIRAPSLLQIRASFITNWGCYYKLGQPLLQNRAAIPNWGKMVIYHFTKLYINSLKMYFASFSVYGLLFMYF